MSELVGRFLSFEEQMGRGLVRFVYYVLLFLLVITTLFDMVTALIGMFTGAFWPNLGRFLVRVPLEFVVYLLLLRVGAELVIAVLSIDDSLRVGPEEGDVMTSGLNPAPAAAAAATSPSPQSSAPAEPDDTGAEPEPQQSAPPAAKKRPAKKKAAKKTAAKKASSKKTASRAGKDEPSASSPSETPGPAKDIPRTGGDDASKKE